MRVVLDTNVFVAAGFNPRSSATRIIEAVRQGVLVLVWDAATRAETQAIIEQIPPLNWAQFADLFDPANEVRGPLPRDAFEQIPDPDDRKFAALAAAAEAVLVSNDVHLLALRDALPIAIRTPRELARALPDS